MNRIGIDVGSKTIKLVVMGEDGQVQHSVYRRHGSNIQKTLVEVIGEYIKRFGSVEGYAAVTGSGGISVARMLGLPFVQEVVATTQAVQEAIPQADAIIELGGEDAKVVYLDGTLEQRMNTTCAGGTGGFIDSIAAMLGIYTREINMYAIRSTRTYPIASRCAVFAQSDVRALMNLGVSKEDIAASALEAVVKQTIGGLACGRPLAGNVVFVGGPFQYIPMLRTSFCKALGLTPETGIKPDMAHLFTVRGAAIEGGKAARKALDAGRDPENEVSLISLMQAATAGELQEEGLNRLEPLFADEAEYHDFVARHAGRPVLRDVAHHARGPLYVGIDAGASEVKVAAVDEQGKLFATLRKPANGDALTAAVDLLEKLYDSLPKGSSAYVARSCVTGSGDEIVQSALRVDASVVETLAHARAARWFNPEASFVLDGGGQDIKALWLEDGQLTDTVLNDPCSSGLGIFMEETAQTLQWPLNLFTDEAVRAKAPVELDTKCIVFMNSRIRHAQKIGADRADIAAGLAYSVAQNAYQRVLGRSARTDFGSTVVVQGGLFQSDAVLRAFELVSGLTCERPSTCEHMGAIGAALTARDQAVAMAEQAKAAGKPLGQLRSDLAPASELEFFDPIYSTFTCTGCSNHCVLSVVRYDELRIFVSGNRCENGAEVVRTESIELSKNDILGTSSMIPRSRNNRKRRDESEIGNGIVIPGYLRSFSGGMLGGGNDHGLADEPRRVDYYAIQLEKDRTRERKIKLVAPTKWMTANEVAKKKQEDAKSEAQKKAEEERIRNAYLEKLEKLTVTSSLRTLKSEVVDVPNTVVGERELLAAFGNAPGTGARGAHTVALPNTLANYARLPFWHTLLAQLGYGVAVPADERALKYAMKGAESIPSESVCDPAKSTHARIYQMVQDGADAVLMPRFTRDGRCAVLCDYASAVADNTPFLFDGTVPLAAPLLRSAAPEALGQDDADLQELTRALALIDPACAPILDEVRAAVETAAFAQKQFTEQLADLGRTALDWVDESADCHAIVLAGRPYHMDAQLLHDIDSKLACMGYAVLSPLVADALGGAVLGQEDGVDALADWKPAARLMRFVDFALEHDRVDLVFLHSFNCGYDAVSIEAARHALAAAERPFAAIRLDDMVDAAHISVQLRTLTETVEAGGVAAAAPLADKRRCMPEQATGCARVLAQGIDAQDLDHARTIVPAGMCFTAAALIARTCRLLKEDPELGQVSVPTTCKDCLVSSLPFFVQQEVGRSVDVVWEDDWQVPEVPEPRSADESEPKPRIGLVGNPLLCFDPFMNEGVADLLASLGAQAVMPDPANLATEDVRYLDQLEQFRADGVSAVLYLQNFSCLKGHVQARGALHGLQRQFPDLPVTVIDYDPESSALNRENRIRLVVTAAKNRLAHA
ncbi:MAG: BadF/BadG/BcrA/BcrD ATPase family protein [Coriobacteriia bacterium]|nr:BadF/BadG/BcrA/BcrD ATPase family protein [Coriobacteriia bacterium]